MNRIDRLICNHGTGAFAAIDKKAKRAGKRLAPCAATAMALMISLGTNAYAQPVGGVVSAGGASIHTNGSSTTITQTTQKTAINWQRFDIAPAESVQFVQPGNSSVALNRVLGSDPSSIMGRLSANGQVFLLNPNGVLFGKGAQVNVGGLVASTLGITDADFMAGRYKFNGAGSGKVLNQGSIEADGGYVALLGANVSNEGVISARLGTVALAGGNAVTLDVAGDGLLNVTVDQGVANALVGNSGRITADGGQVLMTTQVAGSLLQGAVNNTGVVQAQTIENRDGKIMLMGSMKNGTVNAGGTLDASAPNSGDGGFIETSAAHVKIADAAVVTTQSAHGKVGTFLIDPSDYTIAPTGGDTTAADLVVLLGSNDVTINSDDGGSGTNGDIFVNDAVTWTTTNTLTLDAQRDVNINEAITATTGNLEVYAGRDVRGAGAITVTDGNVTVCCGRNLNLGGTLTVTRGFAQLGAGKNVDMAAITMTGPGADLSICAGKNINLNGAATVTDGSVELFAGVDSSGPGGGTVSINASPFTNTTSDVNIYFSPASYGAATDYSTLFTDGSRVTQTMLVYPEVADKIADGTTAATVIGLKGNPSGVSIGAGTANFKNPDPGNNKPVTFTGFSLSNTDFAYVKDVSAFCCISPNSRTTGNIIAGPTPPPSTPPPSTPPPSTPPSSTPPSSTPGPSTPTPTTGPTPPQPSVALLAESVPIVQPPHPPAFVPPLFVAGLDLAVSGIRMPPNELLQLQPAARPVEAPPEVNVPPLPPKPDRN